jgi:hypothetical protein
VSLGICLDEGNGSIACMVYDSTNTILAAVLAVPMIVLQNDNRLPLTSAWVFNLASVEVTIVAVIAADWTDAVLPREQFNSILFPLSRVQAVPFFSSQRRPLTSTPSTSARAFSS